MHTEHLETWLNVQRLIHQKSCQEYLDNRRATYELRSPRYRDVVNWMKLIGLSDDTTVVDAGAGMTQLDAVLRTEAKFRGRYVPIDGAIDGVDFNNNWTPPLSADFYVALEVIEHVKNPRQMIAAMLPYVTKALLVSTPNPEVVDVMAIDETHVTPVHHEDFEAWGADWIGVRSYFGKPHDTLFALWLNAKNTTNSPELLKALSK